MATEASKFKVGLFLIGGFLVLNAALVWIGAARLLEKSAHYVTYFAESVQGLDRGSPVKFRGVPLGRVSEIRVAPDGRLVQVDMEVEPGFRVAPEMRATLASAGITGAAFVEIRLLSDGGEPLEPPTLTFPVQANYIPSQRSFLTNLTSTLSELAVRLEGADIPGLVADYRSLAVTARERLSGPEMEGAFVRLSRAAEAIEASASRLSGFLEDPRLSRAVDRLSATAIELEGAAHSARASIEGSRLPEVMEEVRAAAAGLHQFGEEIRAQAKALRVGERLDTVEGRIDAALGKIDAAAQTAGSGVKGVTDAASRAAARWDRLASDLDRSLQESVARVGRAAKRLENLTASLEASPSRILLERAATEDFR